MDPYYINPVPGISLQDKREGKVRSGEQGFATKSLLHLQKGCLVLLFPLFQIWGTFLVEVIQGAGQLCKVRY